MVFGRLLFFWEGSFSGAMLVLGRVPKKKRWWDDKLHILIYFKSVLCIFSLGTHKHHKQFPRPHLEIRQGLEVLKVEVSIKTTMDWSK